MSPQNKQKVKSTVNAQIQRHWTPGITGRKEVKEKQVLSHVTYTQRWQEYSGHWTEYSDRTTSSITMTQALVLVQSPEE